MCHGEAELKEQKALLGVVQGKVENKIGGESVRR